MNKLTILSCIIIVFIIGYVIYSYNTLSCKKCLENMVAPECNSNRESRNTVLR